MDIWHSSIETPDKDRYVLVELRPEYIARDNERFVVINTNKPFNFNDAVEQWCYIIEIS